MNEVTKRVYTSRGTMTAINVAMSHVARLSQMRAEMMLDRKDPYNPLESSVHQDWYFIPEEKERAKSALDSPSTRPRTRTAERKRRAVKVRRIEGGTKCLPREQLPCYLTSNGCVLSASLEEFGGQVLYCTPSQKSRSEQHEDDQDTIHKDNSSSVFMTDIVCPPSARIEKCSAEGSLLIPQGPPSGGLLGRRASTADRTTTTGTTSRVTICTSRVTSDKSTPSSSGRVSTWQPLNATALLEHTTVSQIPVKGIGHLAHGHYQMWRPKSCHSHTIENSSAT